MGSTRGTIVLIVALVTVFGIEVVSHTMGDESALLKLGALPTNGQLHAEYWRLLTYSFLHLTPLHLLLNVVALVLFLIAALLTAGQFDAAKPDAGLSLQSRTDCHFQSTGAIGGVALRHGHPIGNDD